MRHLGNSYVRHEFKLHLKSKLEHLNPFLFAWENYLNNLKLKEKSFGSNLSIEMKRKLTNEQKLKLNDLKIETSKLKQIVDEEYERKQSESQGEGQGEDNNNNIGDLSKIKIHRSSDHRQNNINE